MSRYEEISEQLGVGRVNSGPEIKHLAGATEGAPLVVAFAAMWRWKSWIAAATDEELFVVRKPKLFGRSTARSWRWADLRSVKATGTLDVEFDFAGERVELRLVARTAYGTLLDFARGPADTTVADLRDLARLKLGRVLAYGEQASVDALPDHLEPGERVERVALAKLEFSGLLWVTDRRLILLNAARGDRRLWETPRAGVRVLEKIEPNRLRLATPDGELPLVDILPEERCDELAAVLNTPHI